MTPDSIIHLLQRVDIFNDVPGESIRQFAERLSTDNYSAGTEIIRKGDRGDSMFVIAAGRVKIHDGEHIVATMGEGNFFGEFSLLDAAPRSMSVSALEDVRIVSINRQLFFELLQNQPEIAKKIVSALTRRLRKQNESIIEQLRSREAELTRLVEERTRELKQKNEEITQKNKEITDNVNYAKRIQTAILPDDAQIRIAFPQSFILYLPKDIVSGDFYSFFPTPEGAVIIAADCTGHGVTGAFLSVVGHSLLTRIINENKINDPGKILDRLNEEVINTLNQRSGESTDGMDVAICSFDFYKNRVSYAGANRPLWLVRNNDILVFAPDKFPIGGMQILHEENFHSHDIELSKNDSLYIFTDGYADQFGGKNGKKFMTKRLKETLLSVQHLPVPEQKMKLSELFLSWKDGYDQVDDVLVIGIRVG